MKILAISDLHGEQINSSKLNGIDICCIIGDIFDDNLVINEKIQYLIEDFFNFMNKHFEIQFLISFGNHDDALEFVYQNFKTLIPKNLHILDFSEYLLNGISFYGIPYIIEDDKLKNIENHQSIIDQNKQNIKISDDIDILLSHNSPINDNYTTGSSIVDYIIEKFNPKYVFCGHNHEDVHSQIKIKNSIIQNVAKVYSIIEIDDRIEDS